MPKQQPNQVEGHELGIGIGCTCLADLQRKLDREYPRGATLDLCQKLLKSSDPDTKRIIYRDFHPVCADVRIRPFGWKKGPQLHRLRFDFNFCPLCGVKR